MSLPITDLHCDLLSYLGKSSGADPLKKEDIGCNFLSLEEGNVKLQVMAIYTSTEKGSSELGLKQSQIFKNLPVKYKERVSLLGNTDTLSEISKSPKLNMIAAIENASGFCEEGESLNEGLKKLETIMGNTGKILYIGFTHHGENRFGGGNTTKVGLKPDGKTLLDYMNEKKIALDFSHTSDALANDMLDYLAKHNLDIPVIASHSNYRTVFNHPRNLPDEIAKEIIKRKGVIGVNFLRAFLNDRDPNAMTDHIMYGIQLGGETSVCFGADYFYTGAHPDQSRIPFYFKENENAACYPSILDKLSGNLTQAQLENLSSKNVVSFVKRVWR